MADTLQTLALLNGKEIALTQAKTLVDKAVSAIAALQVANAAEKAPIVASLQGVPGIGIKSQLTQEAEAERLAGISALIDAIKANHTITPADAQIAWIAGVATVTTNAHLEDPVGIVSAIMRIANCADWNAFLALVVAGNKADLMAAVS